MTILESSALILEWFQKHESFNLKNDCVKLMGEAEIPEHEKAAIQLGLEELVLANAVKRTDIGKQEYFILVRPFDSMTQNVTLGTNTCVAIANVISKTAKQLGRKDIVVNPLNIEENDIVRALSILMETAQIKLDDTGKQ